ncbi:MAG TPA: ribosome-associated translation inhibitor RaiA [Gaiellaceae bacterium]|jgi:putative sigma-54 modulation protein|nr:ribosome-associated translation inhibitor RaiA [Gaiellaceae bacterium]
MQLEVKAHHGSLSDAVRAYAEKRLAKLAKRLHELTRVEVTLSREFNPSIRDDHRAEAVVYTKGPNLVARESAPTYEAAIDLLVEKLERQVERYRDRRVHEPRRAAQRKASPAVVEPLGEASEPERAAGEAAA